MECYRGRYIKWVSKIDSVKESPEGIDCFKGNYWSLVKDDLKEMVDQYLKEKDFFLP